MSRVKRVEAVVLRWRELGEADRLVTLLTREEGKVEAVAKGARRQGSRLVGGVLPFTHGRFLLYRGKQWYTVTSAEPVATPGFLVGNLVALAAASYAAEVTDSLLQPGDPEPAVFALMLDTLRALGGARDAEFVVWAHCLRLLDAVGYRPVLGERCAGCGRTLPPTGPIRVSYAEGGTVCSTCPGPGEDVGRDSVALARRLLEGGWGEVAALRCGPRVRAQVRRLVEGLVVHRLERPVRAAQFLWQVLGQDAGADRGLRG